MKDSKKIWSVSYQFTKRKELKLKKQIEHVSRKYKRTEIWEAVPSKKHNTKS